MRSARRLRLAAAAVATMAIAATTSGCTKGVEVSDLTRQEATDGVEQRIQATAAQLFPDAELEPHYLGDRPCGAFDEREIIAIEHRYWVRGIPPEENVPLILATRDWWLEQGYELFREAHDGTGRFSGISVTGPDEFHLDLRRNPQDSLLLTGSSPCLPRDRE